MSEGDKNPAKKQLIEQSYNLKNFSQFKKNESNVDFSPFKITTGM